MDSNQIQLNQIKTVKISEESNKFEKFLKQIQNNDNNSEKMQSELLINLLSFAQESKLEPNYMYGKIVELLPLIKDSLK